MRKAISLQHPLMCFSLSDQQGILSAFEAGLALRCTYCPCEVAKHQSYTFVNIHLYWNSIYLDTHKWEISTNVNHDTVIDPTLRLVDRRSLLEIADGGRYET